MNSTDPLTPISTAIVGFGASARTFHAPFISCNPRYKLVAFVERSSQKSHEAYPTTKTYQSLDALLQQPPELVVLCTPNALHAQQAAQCLNAGCNVIIEKPFTVHSSEARELIALADAKGLKLSIYHNRRWDGDFRTLQSIIQQGKLGRIVEAEIRYDRWSPGIRPKAWKETGDEGSSLLEDLGSHLIDQAITLFGNPDQVTARLDIQRDNSRTVDAFDLQLGWKSDSPNSGLSVRLKAGMMVRDVLPHYAFFGTRGSYIKYGLDPQESQLQRGISPSDPTYGCEDPALAGILHYNMSTNPDETLWHRGTVSGVPGNYMLFWNEFARALREKQHPPVRAQQALAVMNILEAARSSAQEQRTIFLH